MRRMATAIGLIIASAATALLGATAAEGAGKVQIYKVNYNPAGSDTGSNSHLNQEYVLLKNVGSSKQWITGWTLRDKQGHVYKFPSTSVSAGKYLYVRTGKGTNDWNDRYWGSRWYIWNNTGDKAYLRTPSGTLYDSCEWGSGGRGYKYC